MHSRKLLTNVQQQKSGGHRTLAAFFLVFPLQIALLASQQPDITSSALICAFIPHSLIFAHIF